MKHFAATILCLAAVLGNTASRLKASENRLVRIVNRASSPIRYFHASNVARGSWEEDILGPFKIIATDRYRDVNIDDGSGHCYFDLKAVLADGRYAVRRHFNVCTERSWTVTD